MSGTSKIILSATGIVVLTGVTIYKLIEKRVNRNLKSLDVVFEKSCIEDRMVFDEFMQKHATN